MAYSAEKEDVMLARRFMVAHPLQRVELSDDGSEVLDITGDIGTTLGLVMDR